MATKINSPFSFFLFVVFVLSLVFVVPPLERGGRTNCFPDWKRKRTIPILTSEGVKKKLVGKRCTCEGKKDDKVARYMEIWAEEWQKSQMGRWAQTTIFSFFLSLFQGTLSS